MYLEEAPKFIGNLFRPAADISHKIRGLAWFKTGIWKLRGGDKDLRKEDVICVERKKIHNIYY
jgi:hypothetical protein